MTQLFAMNNDVQLSIRQNYFLKEILPKSVLVDAKKFRNWQDRQAYLGGRYLLLEGLKKLNMSNNLISELKYSKYGRPYLSSNMDFNISHSGSVILCILSDDYKIGIDVEKIRGINIQDFKSQFTEQEFIQINQATNKDLEFFRFWTIKEAVVKADGRGITLNLNTISIKEHANIEGKIWYIKEVHVLPNYIAHVASDSLIPGEIKPESVSIPEY